MNLLNNTDEASQDYLIHLYYHDKPINITISDLYIKDNSDAKDNITVELSKSIFSKSLKFKPIPECPHVAARVVTAIIQKTANLSWSKLMRQTVKNPSTGVKKEVDLYSLINEAASPSDITESWKCYSCGEFVKPKKAVNSSREVVKLFGNKAASSSQTGASNISSLAVLTTLKIVVGSLILNKRIL